MLKKKNTKKNNRRSIGPVVEIIIMILIVSVISLIFNLLDFSGYITEARSFETTLVTVNNIFSYDGFNYILNNSLINFQTLEPLVLIILSLISISILEASGLLKHLFTPLKKIKSKYVTLILIFVSIISTIIGDYSYAFLIPLAGILYKYSGRSSTLGIITCFIGITIGYGTGLIYNYQAYQLGDMTELAAQSIVSNYNYELLSNIFIMIVSTVILTIVATILLENFSKKYPRNEETDTLNTSKKAFKVTVIVFFILLAAFIYCLIPSLPFSGLLLDKSEPTYVGKLFGIDSPLNNGFMIIMIVILMICGFVYGGISRNIKNSDDFSKALSKSFENTGFVFVLLLFASILYEILNWTNLSTIITTNIVDFIGSSNLSGVMLVIVVFLSIILISTVNPMSLTKWSLISPIYVPLLMRANLSPTFAQMIFLASDSVGKLFSPIYVYLIVTIGFIYKYDNQNNGIIKTMKKIMPIILVLGLVWLVIIVGWYFIGLPIGIDTSIAL